MTPTYEIVFRDLFDAGRALTFPCDFEGRVELSKLPEPARNNYLFAHKMVGRQYATPEIRQKEEN